ncbi:MAG: hypothetical protein IBX69_17395 [Anaerolineales bacterium]|nr:hypothetical protein [Anaerolineales bacterium]
MKKNKLSRHNFLQIVAGLGIVPLMSKLQRFFPEVYTTNAKIDAKARAILQIPDDLIFKAIDGEKAEKLIQQVLNNTNVRILSESLASYHPITKESHVTSLLWANGTQKANVISIPFIDHQNNIAVLQYVTKNGFSEINMVEFLDQKDLKKAKIHSIEKGNISTFEVNPEVAFAEGSDNNLSSTCTPSILIQCLGLWGCSGYALVVCSAALLLCPFTIWSCFAVYTCLLYCGGAWSYCFCWACGGC